MNILKVVLVLAVLSACSDRSYTPTVPQALEVGSRYTVFAGTTRQKEPDGSYGYDRSDRLQLLELTVSIPPSHTPGELDFGYANPDPKTQFTMAGRTEFSSPAEFQRRLAQEFAARPQSQREVTVFVHGYNATQAETAFRAAQLASDIKLPGSLMVYSWPSRGKALGYAYDLDSMLFARAGLEQLLYQLRDSGAQRIILIAHSMGGLLTMETLRQMDIRRPGWASRNIGGVILMSPDLDVEVFRSQMEVLTDVPQPFVVFVSQKDKILNLSARLRGTGKSQRLGNIGDIQSVADLPIEIVDTTAFTKGAGSSHFVAATSPALIAMLNDARAINETFGRENVGVEALLPGNFVHLQSVTQVKLAPAEEEPF